MKRLALLLALLVPAATLLPACATFDEVEGVPDSHDWTYFRADAEAVVAATRRALSQAGYTIEGVAEGTGGGATLIVTAGSGGFTEVRVEPTTVAGYGARAQTLPPEQRLSRSLTRDIERNL